MAVIAKQRYKLDIAPKGGWAIVYASQHDDGAREIEFEITNQGNAFSIPASINVSVQGIKSNKSYFSHSCSYSGNIVTMALADDMTDIIGKSICVLKFTNSSQQKLATAKFVLNVDTDSSSEGVIIDTDAEEIFNQMLNDIRAQAASISADIAELQLTVSADIAELQSMVGSPLVASTVSKMTDHNKIYVYVGSESGYTNGNWYYWNGSAWTSGGVYNSTAFETDKTLSVENMAADADVVGKIFENADGIRRLVFVSGYIDVPAVGSVCTPTPTPYADRVCTTAPIAEGEELWIRTRGSGTNTYGGAAWAFLDAENIVLSRSNGSEYVQDGRYIAPAGAARVCITNMPSIESNYYAYVGTPVNKKLSGMGAIQNIVNLAFSNRIFFWQDGRWASNSGRIGTQKVYYAMTNTYVFCDTDFKCAGLFFSSEMPSTATFVRSTGWRQWFLIPAGTYYIINMRRADEAAIYPKDAYEHLHLFVSNIRNMDYVIDTSFQKRGVGAGYLGLLTYWQSFCKYNGKYYCTDGSHIGIQDSNFNAISSTELAVGHGNAFQLGHNGKAYISGWDDNTVYIVDLSGDTPVLFGTIALPTTGYTTCAVDDLNGIVYIFQRDTRPNTVENYNFITYDYINQEIKSTRIINAFSAMQDLDFYEGRIAVAYGLGTETSPSGVTIYNTAGDVLAEFKLEILASNEPEGVLFDRETGDFFVTTGASVFRVDGV